MARVTGSFHLEFGSGFICMAEVILHRWCTNYGWPFLKMFCALGTLSVTQSIRGYNGNLLPIPKPKLQERAHHCSFVTVQKLKSVKAQRLNGRVFVRYREESDKSHPWGGFILGLQKSARSCCSQRLFPICPCNHNSCLWEGAAQCQRDIDFYLWYHL